MALLGSAPECRAAEPGSTAGTGAIAIPTTSDLAPEAAQDPVGIATMEADGTILLQLRAAGPGIIGDALLRYRPGEAGYDAVRDHLPTLRPGITVSVPPFR